MKTPTQAGMIEAARRANEVTRANGSSLIWEARDFEIGSKDQAFALACDELLAKDAQITEAINGQSDAMVELDKATYTSDQATAELATAKAALGEIFELLKGDPKRPAIYAAKDLAAPYAVVTDPLVEALALAGCDRPKEIATKLRERGITIPEAGQ